MSTAIAPKPSTPEPSAPAPPPATWPTSDSADSLPILARLPDLSPPIPAADILATTSRPVPPAIAISRHDWRDVAIRHLTWTTLLIGLLAATAQWRYHRAVTAQRPLPPDGSPAIATTALKPASVETAGVETASVETASVETAGVRP